MKNKFMSIATIALLLLYDLSTEVFAQSTNQNYIRTRTMTNDAGSTYIETIQYFDGLGRLTETVQTGINPSGIDLATYQEYDDFGRESIAWLPRVKTGTEGAFVPLSTFKTLSTTIYQSDAKPYSQTVYESSPLDRIGSAYP